MLMTYTHGYRWFGCASHLLKLQQPDFIPSLAQLTFVRLGIVLGARQVLRELGHLASKSAFLGETRRGVIDHAGSCVSLNRSPYLILKTDSIGVLGMTRKKFTHRGVAVFGGFR